MNCVGGLKFSILVISARMWPSSLDHKANTKTRLMIDCLLYETRMPLTTTNHLPLLPSLPPLQPQYN